MKKFSFVGTVLVILYALVGIYIVYQETRYIPFNQVGGLMYLIYTLPWPLLLASFGGGNVHPIVFVLFAVLNALILYAVGTAIGSIFTKVLQVFRGSSGVA